MHTENINSTWTHDLNWYYLYLYGYGYGYGYGVRRVVWMKYSWFLITAHFRSVWNNGWSKCSVEPKLHTNTDTHRHTHPDIYYILFTGCECNFSHIFFFDCIKGQLSCCLRKQVGSKNNTCDFESVLSAHKHRRKRLPKIFLN